MNAARWCALSVFLVSCVVCDQLTKHVAMSRLKGQPPRSYCRGVVRLEYAENPGAFLGLGGHMPRWARFAVLTVANGVVAGGVAWVIATARRISLLGFAAGALLLAGAMGNLIDRVRWDGLVIDFLNLGVGRLRTGVFNVADMSIMAGAALLLVGSFAGGTPTDCDLRPHSGTTL